MQNVSGKA